MEVVKRNVADLSNDPANARKHDDRNIDAIVASLRRFGQQKPIVIDKSDVVRAGNGTLEAARRLGWESIDCTVTGLESIEATAYAIADNRTAELAVWDDEFLAATLEPMDDEMLSDVGFTSDELSDLLSEVNPSEIEDVEPQISRADELQKEWGTTEGQLWIIEGQQRHRLLCGDATKSDDVVRLLGGESPFLMVTDPPYGVEYDADWRDSFNTWGTAATTTDVENDDQVDWTKAYQLSPCVVAYVWHADRFAAELVLNLHEAGFGIRTQIIWKKPTLIMSRGHYHWQHEPCWYAVRKGSSAKWCGDRTQSTIWEIQGMHAIGRSEDRVAHPTQKPLECMARPIRNHGRTGDDVYDPFAGSGTTLLASEGIGRRCFGMEISPAYCAVILQRMTDAGCTCRLEEASDVEAPQAAIG
jgi:DNA modification methylase